MLTFILVVLLLFLIPGPAVIVTVSQSLKGGLKAGFMTGVGIAIGDLLHTLAAVLGLSAILMTSAAAFEVVKYAGVAYLVYLGIRSFAEKSKPAEKKETPSMTFRQAILIELLNPKTSLFFLAFLPQFVKADGPSVAVQLLLLGLTFVIMGILYTTVLALLISTIGDRFIPKNGRISRWQGKIVGAVYIGLGLRLAMESQN